MDQRNSKGTKDATAPGPLWILSLFFASFISCFSFQLTSLVVFLDDQSQKVVRKVVTEGTHRRLELVKVNGTALVLIKGTEARTPFLNVLPQARELCKVDQSRVV